LNLPAGTQLTKEVLQQQAKDLVQTGYEPVKQAGTITTGRVYRQALDAIEQKFMSKSFPAADKQEISKLIDAYRVGGYQADDAVKKISLLRREAIDAFKPGGDSSIGLAKRELAKALENNIELNLQARATAYANMLQQTGARNVKLKGPSPVEILDNFKAARVALAKNNAVEQMLADAHTGTIDTVKAASLLKKGVPLTDELLTIAKAGSPQFSEVTKVVRGGKPSPVNFGDMGYMAAGGISSPFTGGIGGALAAYPAIKAGARALTLSNPMQKMLFASKPNAAGAGSIFGGAVGGPAAFGVPAQLLPLFGQDQ
jgi:hypothetical protein